jgi:hypothetical protein
MPNDHTAAPTEAAALTDKPVGLLAHYFSKLVGKVRYLSISTDHSGGERWRGLSTDGHSI